MSERGYQCCGHCLIPRNQGHGAPCHKPGCLAGRIRITNPPSSTASATKPAESTGEQRRALLARQERYSEAVYGDGRGVTERVRVIMAIADAEVRAATNTAADPEATIKRLEAEVKARLLEATTERYEHDAEVAMLRGQLQAALGEVVRLEAEVEADGALVADLQTGLVGALDVAALRAVRRQAAMDRRAARQQAAFDRRAQ